LRTLSQSEYQLHAQQSYYECLEVDEFWTFVGNKQNKQWLIYAYHRESGAIVAYVWGKRDLATVQRLKARLKKLGVQYTRIASDHWDSFITAFKCCKQVIGKFFTSFQLKYILIKQIKKTLKHSFIYKELAKTTKTG